MSIHVCTQSNKEVEKVADILSKGKTDSSKVMSKKRKRTAGAEENSSKDITAEVPSLDAVLQELEAERSTKAGRSGARGNRR